MNYILQLTDENPSLLVNDSSLSWELFGMYTLGLRELKNKDGCLVDDRRTFD